MTILNIHWQVFYVTKISFSRQNNIRPEKGTIPVKMTAEPTLASVALASWNLMNKCNDNKLPCDLECVVTDNTKKKVICQILTD